MFVKFRLCQPFIHTGDKVEFDSLLWSTVTVTGSVEEEKDFTLTAGFLAWKLIPFMTL